ncbi:MAG: sugar phosphate nucleotidyltransferase, partial [Planctomycetota bacterium]
MTHPSEHPRHAVILAGGRGTRFWPASRHSRAKQFLAVGGRDDEEARSLLTRTWDRLGESVPSSHRWVICGSDQVELVRESLPALPNENLLPEPLGRNTAACAAWAAHAIAAREAESSSSPPSFCLLPS